jgi:hypothetical protein
LRRPTQICLIWLVLGVSARARAACPDQVDDLQRWLTVVTGEYPRLDLAGPPHLVVREGPAPRSSGPVLVVTGGGEVRVDREPLGRVDGTFAPPGLEAAVARGRQRHGPGGAAYSPRFPQSFPLLALEPDAPWRAVVAVATALARGPATAGLLFQRPVDVRELPRLPIDDELRATGSLGKASALIAQKLGACPGATPAYQAVLEAQEREQPTTPSIRRFGDSLRACRCAVDPQIAKRLFLPTAAGNAVSALSITLAAAAPPSRTLTLPPTTRWADAYPRLLALAQAAPSAPLRLELIAPPPPPPPPRRAKDKTAR